LLRGKGWRESQLEEATLIFNAPGRVEYSEGATNIAAFLGKGSRYRVRAKLRSEFFSFLVRVFLFVLLAGTFVYRTGRKNGA
jgi:hypothetical protein